MTAPDRSAHPVATRDDRSRGAAAVELAIVLPLLLLLAFGAADIGYSWQSAGNARAAVSHASRAGAQSGTDRLADFAILQTLRGALGDDLDNVRRVVVYRVRQGDPGTPPTPCLTAGALTSGGVGGRCNVYDLADVTGASAGDFASPSCAAEMDRQWCPTARQVSADFVGVYVQIDHEWVTAALPGSRTISQYAVARLEPND